MGVIIYGTHYGSSKRYAEALGKRIGFPVYNVKDLKKVPGLADQVQVVHIGSLIAGSVTGLKDVLRADLNPSVQLTVATVGLGDPDDPETMQNIMQQLEKYERLTELDAQIFGLRGAYNHQEASFIHRIMMGMMYRMLRSKPKNEQPAGTEFVLATQHTPVDMVDFSKLEPIVQALK